LSDVAGIGEIDNPIIKNPINKLPYIPGSSLKGKIRYLLEKKHGYKNYYYDKNGNKWVEKKTNETGKACECGECNICLLFGCGEINRAKSPTRLILRDYYPDKKTIDSWESLQISTEEKTEVTIDRESLKANPRQMERIPANSSFDFSFSLRVFEGDKLKDLLNFLAEGFEFLEKDYLGGCGSRANGHVNFFLEDGKTHMHEYLRSDEVLKIIGG